MPMSDATSAARTAAERLSEAIRFKTVSSVDANKVPRQEFMAFQAWLALAYPRVHAELARETFGPWALLFRLPGRDPGLKPILLLAHYDVVPAENPELWRFPPFDGRIEEGYVWGRGALDVKNTLISVMEAMEGLLAAGFRPERGVLIAFGGDEEVGGSRGAASIAQRLAAYGIEAEYLVDEGSIIADGLLPFMKRPAALIGLSEKGFLNLSITVAGKSGHASMPGSSTAAGRLSRALAYLESHPFPARLSKTLERFLKAASPHASLGLRFAFAFPKAFWPFIRASFARHPRTDALIRTTQAITMLKASPKENVLPESAQAVVNIRVMPGERIAATVERVRRLMRRFGAEVEIYHPEHMNEAMAESPDSGPAYAAILAALKATMPEAVPIPFLVTVGTDTNHYEKAAGAIYRFMPVVLDSRELAGIHGVDERISIENLEREIAFYRALISG
jgi:carboxypeptidase PM20D1